MVTLRDRGVCTKAHAGAGALWPGARQHGDTAPAAGKTSAAAGATTYAVGRSHRRLRLACKVQARCQRYRC